MEKFYEVFPAVLKQLELESDRGLILVTASFVEKELFNHLENRLLNKLKPTDELLHDSDFDFKIKLSYRVGIITKNESEIYHQLRTLRNTCAHEIENQSFNNDQFMSSMNNIIRKSPDLWKVMKNKLRPEALTDEDCKTVKSYVKAIGWRSSFEIFFGLIISHKMVNSHRATKIVALY